MSWKADLSDKLGYLLDIPEESPIFDPRKKHDFVFFFDATNCNPNGDPDNDNTPRQDLETKKGLVTDVCIKRKIRDFLGRVYGTAHENPPDKEGFYLYVKHKGILACEHRETAEKLGKSDNIEENQQKMRKRYWDVRLFGAVLSVGKEDAEETSDMEGQNAEAKADDTPAPKLNKDKSVKKDMLLNGGQCVGPMQIGWAESVTEISPLIAGIVRDALVNPTDVKRGRKEDVVAASAMPGGKPYLPYALYECRGHYSPSLDRGNLVTATDLAIFWNALRQMFDQDISSARAGAMRSLAAGVFTHEHPLGNFPVHLLFDRVRAELRPGINPDKNPPRKFTDYDLRWPEVDQVEKGVKGVIFTTLFNDWRT